MKKIRNFLFLFTVCVSYAMGVLVGREVVKAKAGPLIEVAYLFFKIILLTSGIILYLVLVGILVGIFMYGPGNEE